MTEKTGKFTRRDFLGTTTLSMAGVMLSPSTPSLLRAVKTTSDRINVGIIGPGARGRELIRALSTLAGTRITTMCEIFEPNLSRAVSLAGSHPMTCTDYRKLLESKDVDAVVIATPLHLHAEEALATLEAGKHLFLEKTMAYSVEQCDQIARAAKAHPSLVVQIGFQRHYSPVVRRAVEMAKDGAIGTITHVRCNWHRNGNWRRPVPDVKFDPSPWGYPSLEHLINWRMYKKYSQGLMAELGSHMLEVVNMIYDAMPTAVTGFGGIDYWKDGRETYDNVVVVYTYPGGQKAIFSSITTNAHHGEMIQIMGTDGTIELGWDQAQYYYGKEPTGTVKTDEGVVITSTGETMPAKSAQAKGAPVSSPSQKRVDPTQLALEAFLTCIREGKKPEVDVEVGRNGARCVLLANRAMEEGRVVKF
jgi:predicted dehydrogenase